MTNEDLDLISSMDLITYSEDSMYGLWRRIADKTCKNPLNTNHAVRIGLVIEVFGEKFVVDSRKKGLLIPLIALKDRIKGVYRDNLVANMRVEYSISRVVSAILVRNIQEKKVNLLKLAKKMNKGCIDSMFLTLVFASTLTIAGDAIGKTSSIDSFLEGFGSYYPVIYFRNL